MCILNRLDGPRGARGDFPRGLDGRLVRIVAPVLKNFKMQCVKVKKTRQSRCLHRPPSAPCLLLNPDVWSLPVITCDWCHARCTSTQCAVSVRSASCRAAWCEGNGQHGRRRERWSASKGDRLCRKVTLTWTKDMAGVSWKAQHASRGTRSKSHLPRFYT